MARRDLASTIASLCADIKEHGVDEWWLKPEVNYAFNMAGFHLIPRHFYSPIPDPETTAKYDPATEYYPLDNLNFKLNVTNELLKEISPFVSEMMLWPDNKNIDEKGFYWNNNFFGSTDAIILYALIRYLKPKRVIEVGAGFSSHVTVAALRKNGDGHLVCIEPHPTDKLKELENDIEFLHARVQDIDCSLFGSLDKNDILFIDSSHVGTLGSDVNHELLRIIPSLRNGVYVHAHDIWLPFEYPKIWTVERRWYWNEQYLLYALLLMNREFEIIVPNRYLLVHAREDILNLIAPSGRTDLNGSSFWMRCTRRVESDPK